MKKIILLLVVLLLSVSLLSACSKESKEKVYVYNWGEYIDEEVLDLFEEETGIEVVYDEFDPIT
ncbi:MAG: putative secreted protein [Herbinix sp.]|nr:putative secreted protein [Herbinix sp.]